MEQGCFEVVWARGGSVASPQDTARARLAAQTAFGFGLGWDEAQKAADRAGSVTWDDPDAGEVRLLLREEWSGKGKPAVRAVEGMGWDVRPTTRAALYRNQPSDDAGAVARQLLAEVLTIMDQPAMSATERVRWLNSLVPVIRLNVGGKTDA